MSGVTDFVGTLVVQRMFDQAKDESGNISVGQAKELLQANLISMLHPYVVAVFDPATDTALESYNCEQFCALYKQIKQNTVISEDSEAIMQKFRRYDKNGDGFITEDELREILKAGGYYDESEFDVAVKLVMQFGDTNGDNMLNYIEFVDMMKSTDD